MTEERYRRIGAKIKYYRQMKGFSQSELADIAGISPQYLSKIECGRQTPSIPVLLLLAEKLVVDASCLLSSRDM